MVYLRKVLRFRGILLGERMEKTDEIRRISVKIFGVHALYLCGVGRADAHALDCVSSPVRPV